MDFNYRLKPGRKRKTRDDAKCLVCDGPSIGLNFGVQTCSPCKAFFRRNAVKLGTYEFVCHGDGDCPVTSNTRRQCNCCRLAKCFRVGMDRRAIRTDDQRLERNRLVELNRHKRAEEQQIMIRSSNLLNTESSSLSSNDQTLLTNILSAYDRTCVSLRYQQQLKMSDDNTLSLEKFMNSCAHIYMGLIEYFKVVPEFSNLSVNLKTSLVKNNLNQIFRLNSGLIVKATGLVDPNSSIFISIFPPDLFVELCKCIAEILPFVFDPILLKLLLIILMFSTHLNIQYDKNFIDTENASSTLQIFHIQNMYVEVLWRYILHRSSNFRQAVKLFSSFITRLVYSQYVNVRLNEFVSRLTPNKADQLVPIMKTMWLNEKK